MSAHTPGPWETSTLLTDAPNKEWTVCGPDGGDIIADLTHNANAEADARLIAAAPELLAALRQFVSLCPSSEGLGGHAPIGAFFVAAEAARAAIAKAVRS